MSTPVGKDSSDREKFGQDEYNRGVDAGKIDARLAGHDQHFAKINGSIEKMANEMHNLVLAVQQLKDGNTNTANALDRYDRTLGAIDQLSLERLKQPWGSQTKLVAIISAVGIIMVVLISVIVSIVR